MALSVKWFDNYTGTPEQKEQLEKTIRGSKYVLDILTAHIEREIVRLEAAREADYDRPNWAMWVADRNGQVRKLKDLLTMTKL